MQINAERSIAARDRLDATSARRPAAAQASGDLAGWAETVNRRPAAATQLGQPRAPASEPQLAACQVAEQRRQAIVAAGRELRKPLSVLGGVTEYYRHRDQLTPGEFDRLLARVADETARIDAIISDRLGPGPDEPGPPA